MTDGFRIGQDRGFAQHIARVQSLEGRTVAGGQLFHPDHVATDIVVPLLSPRHHAVSPCAGQREEPPYAIGHQTVVGAAGLPASVRVGPILIRQPRQLRAVPDHVDGAGFDRAAEGVVFGVRKAIVAAAARANAVGRQDKPQPTRVIVHTPG